MNIIETDRLILRGWKEEDYLDLHEILSHEGVAINRGCAVVKDIETSKKIIDAYIKYNQCYAVVLKTESKVIGSIGMDDVAPDEALKDLKQRYVGYAINPNYWGKGYATEAFKGVIKYLSKELKLDLIWSSHYDFNVKSKRVIEKAELNYKFSREVKLKSLGDRIVNELFYNIA